MILLICLNHVSNIALCEKTQKVGQRILKSSRAKSIIVVDDICKKIFCDQIFHSILFGYFTKENPVFQGFSVTLVALLGPIGGVFLFPPMQYFVRL